MTVPSDRFRRLAFWTGVATLLLIVVGGIVRVSESGLGCGPAGSGLHGWPFCNGDVVPGFDPNAVIEYTHRVLAAGVGLAMLVLAIWTWRSYRASRGLVRAATAAVVLVALQGMLGGVVVEENLEASLVAAHLALAMVLLALIAYIWRASRADVIGAAPVDAGPRFRAVAAAAQVALFLAIVAGGYMAGTQKFGRADFDGSGAHHACGTQFPLCNDQLLPFGQAPLVDVHLTHRLLVYLAAVLILWLVAMAIRRRPSARLVRMAWVALAMLTLQLVVGALNVWLADIYEALIVLHLLLATVLWGHLFGINLQLYRVAAPSGVAGTALGRAETAVA